MGPFLKAALAFWTHMGLEEGLGARSHIPCKRERQRRFKARFFDRSGAGRIMEEPQFAQTETACGLSLCSPGNQTTAPQIL